MYMSAGAAAHAGVLEDEALNSSKAYDDDVFPVIPISVMSAGTNWWMPLKPPSRGPAASMSGMWISGGEFAYPVEEITVAGNLKELFFNISEIANDLEFRGAVAAPTIRVDGLTVGGE